MTEQAKEIIARFMGSVHGWQLRRIQAAISEGYELSQQIFELLNLESPLERQAKGHLRGSIISQKLLGLNAPEDGIKVELRENSLKSFSFAEIKLNELARLTIKTNDDPSTLPEESDYRADNAKANPEYVPPLLELLDKQYENSTEDLIDGIITHRSMTTGSPQFLSVVFPCKWYKNVLGYKDFVECCEELEATEDRAMIRRRPAPIDHEKISPKLRKQG